MRQSRQSTLDSLTFSRRIRRASLRFVSLERVSWQKTRVPVGTWSRLTAFEVLFVAWPPGPEPEGKGSELGDVVLGGVRTSTTAGRRSQCPVYILDSQF